MEMWDDGNGNPVESCEKGGRVSASLSLINNNNKKYLPITNYLGLLEILQRTVAVGFNSILVLWQWW